MLSEKLWKKTTVSILILCLLCLAAGCAKKAPQKVTLTLPSNPTTGYQWIAAQDPELFEISSEYIENKQEGEAVGVGGNEVFILTPIKDGETEVSFSYARSWEEQEPESVLRYNLKVSKDKQIQMQSFTGALPGSMEELPDVPSLVIE